MKKKTMRNDRKGAIPAEQAAETVKKVARNIREVSSTARETVKKIHESGANSQRLYRKLRWQPKRLRKKLVILPRKLETVM